MAKLEGILPLRGTIGNMTFAHTKNGVIVREKTSLNKARIDTDPAYARTRENNADFATAAKSAKLLSSAFRASLPGARDSGIFTRSLKFMKQALNFDTTNVRGQRNVVDGQLSTIDGFNFNAGTPLDSIFFVPYTASIDRTSGEVEVVLPAYIPTDSVLAPVNATHYRIVATAAELNFTDYQEVHETQQPAEVALNSTTTMSTTLTCTLPANSTQPLVLALGIEFLMESGATKYPLKDGSAHAIIKLDA